MESTMWSISSLVMNPSLSRSYNLKAPETNNEGKVLQFHEGDSKVPYMSNTVT